MSSTIDEQLLTVWDTGAVVAVVPKSTIEQTGTDWVRTSDIDLVFADGQRHSSLGYAPKFVFRIGDIYFVLKVYMVEGANYQLLLVTSFIYDTGAALFPRWETVKLTIPIKLEIHAVTDPIDRRSCPPLKDETVAARVVAGKLKALRAKSLASESGKDDSGIEVVELDDPEEVENPAMVVFMWQAPKKKPMVASVNMVESVPVLTINEAVGTTYRLGTKDLVSEVEEVQLEADLSRPVLTPAFVESIIEFGETVPKELRDAVCGDIVDYSHVFSWNAFDLGCIKDVPYKVIRTDSMTSIQPFRQYMYPPFNQTVLHEKCDAYIELGIFTPALVECKDRTQLTIVHTAKDPKDGNNIKYCRIAHDFRALNDKIQADPEPVDSVADMITWMSMDPTGLFFKTDADRGFYQIVCADDDGGEAINSTCFELFRRLGVSLRMLFGQKNGSATFKRNAVIMQEELLQEDKTKSYFNDIIGKTSKNDFQWF